ncbi:MAG: cyclic pyranopterin monophosphate synthase [Acidimicrobiales bacterium]
MTPPGLTPRQLGGQLTHIDQHGRARMVDITAKPITARLAVARCLVRAERDAVRRLPPAGDVDPLAAAKVAGIQAAKLTYQLIPLCHPLLLGDITVEVDRRDDGFDVEATAAVDDRTGVEMEALTACGAAGLSLVMALMPFDPLAHMDQLTLWHKSGGRSGTWERRSGTPGDLR